LWASISSEMASRAGPGGRKAVDISVGGVDGRWWLAWVDLVDGGSSTNKRDGMEADVW
jgi:hypothetical protein